ncbi:MAG: F0F1 ATP synthase subunit delta [Lachnospiraceae bacterium]|jgi:F-type H+-transporting ATPase subunit delta|nr:F0F1 ATP synthase subunit delta [Lachnospiraceae bacterium]MCI9281778.1 F0F1 ATP synthase subunit delta [Lachnospiraceae bacterium]
MAKLVSKVYGDALFETAMEKDRIDVLYEEIVSLVPVLEGNPELMALLNNPRIVKEEKVTIIHQVFEGRVEEELMGFLTVVVEKDRQNDLIPIFAYFIQRVKEYKRIGTVSVTSAVELSEEQKARLQEKLLETTDYVMFEMNYQIDSALIGGMVIRIGDRVVDSSIRTRLYEMKKELSQLQMA